MNQGTPRANNADNVQYRHSETVGLVYAQYPSRNFRGENLRLVRSGTTAESPRRRDG
jgi:hypothetical protein